MLSSSAVGASLTPDWQAPARTVRADVYICGLAYRKPRGCCVSCLFGRDLAGRWLATWQEGRQEGRSCSCVAGSVAGRGRGGVRARQGWREEIWKYCFAAACPCLDRPGCPATLLALLAAVVPQASRSTRLPRTPGQRYAALYWGLLAQLSLGAYTRRSTVAVGAMKDCGETGSGSAVMVPTGSTS